MWGGQLATSVDGRVTPSYPLPHCRSTHPVLQNKLWEAATICPAPCKLTQRSLQPLQRLLQPARKHCVLAVVRWSRGQKVPFDLESGVRVTCDMGYLSASFSLPRLLCSRLRPDVRDRRQTDVKRTLSLNAPTMGAGA